MLAFYYRRDKQNREKVWNLQKAFSLRTIKVCRFEIIDSVKYIYCTKHSYKFLLSEQVGFAAILWLLRQCVSCVHVIYIFVFFLSQFFKCLILFILILEIHDIFSSFLPYIWPLIYYGRSSLMCPCWRVLVATRLCDTGSRNLPSYTRDRSF